MPSAGLHAAVCRGSEVKQPLIGLGETHSLAYSSQRKITCITTDIRNCGFRSVWSSRILACRRKTRRDSSKAQGEFGNSLESSRFFSLGCLDLGWSQRFPFTSAYAHSNNGSKNIPPESPRFDSEGDTEYAEKMRNNSVFQDYGKHADGEEPYGIQWQKTKDHVDSSPNSGRARDSNGGYMNLSRNDSNASDLFREGSDSVWPEEKRVVDDDGGANGVGYESWGEESEKSTDSGISGSVVSMSGSAADSLAIGGKEPVYQVGHVHLKCLCYMSFLQ